MSLSSERGRPEVADDGPLYPTIARRLQALNLDSVILLGASALAFGLVWVFQRWPAVRVGVLGSWWLLLVLYEPVLVSHRGGTIGHFCLNLCVVANSSGSAPSLPRAFARFLLKGLLGLFSFLFMSTSRRHQALHDILTDCSVRVRHAEVALPHHYAAPSRMAMGRSPGELAPETGDAGVVPGDLPDVDGPPGNRGRLAPLVAFLVILALVIALAVA